MPDDILTSDDILAAYAAGYFPMAQSREAGELRWFSPVRRGILPFGAFHIPRSLKRFLRDSPYEVRVDTAFEAVIRACADERSESRKDTWINDSIIALYTELHRNGYAHSVECWEGGEMVGGLYGVALGGAFFGESMFSRRTNASKVALVRLVEGLKRAGYLLLDTQYVNDHLKQFGAAEIPRADYLELLTYALNVSPDPSAAWLQQLSALPRSCPAEF